MPSNTGDEIPSYLLVETEDIKAVSEYTGLNFKECLELNCYEYRQYFKDAFVYKYKQFKEGREYLEDCWLLQQTKPDKNKLREKFGKAV